jgi:leucyl aminopeptidase
MEIKITAGDITKFKADAIIVNFFAGVQSLDGDLATIDKALNGAISQLISQGEIKGKLNEITLVHSLGKLPAARVVIASLGKQPEVSRWYQRGGCGSNCDRRRSTRRLCISEAHDHGG